MSILNQFSSGTHSNGNNARYNTIASIITNQIANDLIFEKGKLIYVNIIIK